ncbi:hypothetical protein HPP92_027061 [Vanilla planifolia]|uniref:FH2 domain-containing protein n=1 Tax=Vanilla planifolia TaxID=51239 RepID=A0A835PCY2_VANPL|nr:hypothetical protein HPP92_027061 [Vanilla planifolia]
MAMKTLIRESGWHIGGGSWADVEKVVMRSKAMGLFDTLAFQKGNADSLGTDLLETLLRMAPNKEEELKLREHNDSSSFKLGPAERFLKALLGIPFAFKS